VDKFLVESPFQPAGDQPKAIAQLAQGVEDGLRYQTLEGITGSGKTATIAWLIEHVQRPTLILEPNKSLAAQLASELKEMLPRTASSSSSPTTTTTSPKRTSHAPTPSSRRTVR